MTTAEPIAAPAPLLPRAWVQMLLVVAACIAVYWIGLDASGFASSEGHRVAPAWEMARSDDHLVTRMFGQVYVRKPPGMTWAIAASTRLFGETEFAARAVSALAMTACALGAWFFAARWFGRPWGLAGGLALALMPLMWRWGRSAEIEALNAGATAIGIWALLDALLFAKSRGGSALSGGVAALSLAAAAFAKGPASLPCLAGAIVAACVCARSLAPLARPGLWAMLAGLAVLVAPLAWLIGRRLAALDEPIVAQSPGEFLWDRRKLFSIVALAPVALATALPTSLAALLAWQRPATDDEPRRALMARALAVACLASLVIYTVAGIANPRYAMPAVLLLAPLVAHLARLSPDLDGRARALARTLLLPRPWAWPAILLIAAAIFATVSERRRAEESGKSAGFRLAEQLEDGAIFSGDHIVEARPEVFLYARLAAELTGKRVEPRWLPAGTDPAPLPPPGGFVVLRSDPGSDELARYREAGVLRTLTLVGKGTVGRGPVYEFVIYRRPVRRAP